MLSHDMQDIDRLFASDRADIKGDADLLKAVRRLLIEKVIAPYAIETSGTDRAAVIKPAIDQASFKVSDPKGKCNARLSKSNLARILNGVTTGGNEATIIVQVSTSHMCTDLRNPKVLPSSDFSAIVSPSGS